MRSSPRSLHLLAAAFAVVVLCPTVASAQDSIEAMIPGCDALRMDSTAKPPKENMAEARERYERGRQLYADGAFEQSQLEFERAYELAPAYRILYNIAQVAMLLNDHPKAICAFEAYLSQGTKVDNERRQQVESELKKLRGRVAYLEIESNVTGAMVQLDDYEIGETPLTKPVMVNAGRHRIIAKYPGMQSGEDIVTLAGQDRQKVVLELKESSKIAPGIITPVPTPSGSGPAPPPPPAEPSYVWVGWLTTGTLAAGAVATGLGALFAANKLGDLRETAGVTKAELDDQQSTARALGIATDVLAASAAVAGGVTLYFAITEDDDGDALSAGVSPTGVTLTGRF
jgi:PEGA domain